MSEVHVFIVGVGQSCRTEPLTCEIWHHLQIDKIEFGFILLHVIFSFPNLLQRLSSFPASLGAFVKDLLIVYMCVYFCAIYPLPLVYVSFFMPVPSRFDYYYLKSGRIIPPVLSSSQDFFGYWVLWLLIFILFILATLHSLLDLSSSNCVELWAHGSESTESNHWTADSFFFYFICNNLIQAENSVYQQEEGPNSRVQNFPTYYHNSFRSLYDFHMNCVVWSSKPLVRVGRISRWSLYKRGSG